MKVVITYKTRKTRVTRTKAFYRDTLKEALSYFNWRYGHEILAINGHPYEPFVPDPIPVVEPMVAGENCGAFMADGSRMV